MEIKQLEYFRAIVDAGTISGAARELHMTQPPLSYQIKMLEEELKVSLFLRGTKRITLTEAGKTLYEQAEKILTLTELTKSEVIKSSQATTLHIGLTPSTVSMMSDYLMKFAQRYPKIRFDIHEGSTFTLKEQIENQQVDITTLRTPIALNGCETKSLVKERLMAMAVPEYPLFAGKTSVSLRELIDQPLILSRRYQKYMLSAFEKAGVVQDFYCACEDARTAIIMAEKGLGIAILPASMLKQSEKLKAWEVEDADLATEILLVWRKGRMPVEVKAFLEMMEESSERK
ncbi:LysR family transcriptional regulator [Brotaphodocola sp.]|uniref:LysR family transcriptional regulator n=1 Tax=Brotaphodocola sp. TaxID=3073577 RepID=UPI003D7EA2A1